MKKNNSGRETIRLENGFLVTPDCIVRSEVVLRDGRIDLSAPKAAGEHVINIDGKYVVPGFVDIHFHGYNLFDFTLGQFCPETNDFDSSEPAYGAGFEMLSKTLARFGVTGFYVSTLAAASQTLKNCCGNLTKYLKKKQNVSAGARMFGVMLEGSFINPDMAAAQNVKYLFEPSRQVFDSIEDTGSIKLANVVPDFGQSSVKLIEYLCDKGIVVGAGHTNATCEQFSEAVKAGLKYCIHFTNGPTGGSYKTFNGGGSIEAVLKFDEIYAELIADGYHVNPAYVRDIIHRKGVGKILGVTDCMFVAGSSVKQIEMDGVSGQVSDDGKYIVLSNKPNTLYGSNLTMDRAFENMLNWLSREMEGIWNHRHPALGFEEALAATARIYSSNPCELTGLKARGFGRIANGAKADICVLDIVGSAGSYKVQVESTIVDGDIVYSKS